MELTFAELAVMKHGVREKWRTFEREGMAHEAAEAEKLWHKLHAAFKQAGTLTITVRD